MSNQILNQQLNFEKIKHTENSSEFWLARELMPLLGYSRFDSFKRIIIRVSEEIETEKKSFHNDVELLKTEENNPNPKEDYKLSRFACYKIAMLGNTAECVQDRTYFAVQTRKQELAAQNMSLDERKNLRKQSKESYKSYNSTLVDNGVNEGQIGIITSMGDKALFGEKNRQNKKR